MSIDPETNPTDTTDSSSSAAAAKPKSDTKKEVMSGVSSALSGFAKSEADSKEKMQGIADKASQPNAVNDSTPQTPMVKGGTLGSFKHGTESVPMTGNYRLHKNETVVPNEKDAKPEMRKSMYREIYNNRKSGHEQK